jgi:ribosome maturation factor RimP
MGVALQSAGRVIIIRFVKKAPFIGAFLFRCEVHRGFFEGPRALFFMVPMKRANDIWSLVESVATGLGYEVVDVEFRPHPRNGLLRIYIDKPEGILLEDCEIVSRQVSAMLDVEDPIPGQYRLEVSSPGLDRPLRKAADFERFAGEIVKIRMGMPTAEGQRNFTGKLLGIKDQDVRIEVDGEELSLSLGGIEKAQIVPQF